MISIEDLSVLYGAKEVLSHLSCVIPTGKITGIIGENGAGKTTLMSAIAGLISVPRERILLDGKVLTWKKIAFVSTNPFFYSYITGRDYLSLFRKDEDIIEKWRILLNLPLDEFIDTYSSGMQKKLAIAGAVSSGRKILIMDEPFNSLDLESVFLLQKVLKALRSHHFTVIISSHIIETLMPICDTILEMESGSIILRNPEQYLLMYNSLRDKYENKYDTLLNEIMNSID